MINLDENADVGDTNPVKKKPPFPKKLHPEKRRRAAPPEKVCQPLDSSKASEAADERN